MRVSIHDRYEDIQRTSVEHPVQAMALQIACTNIGLCITTELLETAKHRIHPDYFVYGSYIFKFKSPEFKVDEIVKIRSTENTAILLPQWIGKYGIVAQVAQVANHSRLFIKIWNCDVGKWEFCGLKTDDLEHQSYTRDGLTTRL